MKKYFFLLLCCFFVLGCERSPRYVNGDVYDPMCYDDNGVLRNDSTCAKAKQAQRSGTIPQRNNSNIAQDQTTVIAHYPGLPAHMQQKTVSPPKIDAGTGTRFLNHEANLRCKAPSARRAFTSTIPFDNKAFLFKRRFAGDLLPLKAVSDFEIINNTVDDAFRKLLKESNVNVVCVDGPFPHITASRVKGELSQIAASLAEVGDVYITYKEDSGVMEIARKADFILYTPRSSDMLLAIVDGLRGLGIYDLTPDFAEYAVTFKADKNMERRVNRLIETFDKEPAMIAFDISLYRICDNEQCNPWQDVLKKFGVNQVVAATNGLVGSAFSVQGELDSHSLINYLNDKDVFYQLLAQGTSIVPNGWQSRFDVGKCSMYNSPERALSMMIQAVARGSGADVSISLDNEVGEITTFSLPTRFEDNIFLINIPTRAVGATATGQVEEHGELFLVLSPRLVQTVKQEAQEE